MYSSIKWEISPVIAAISTLLTLLSLSPASVALSSGRTSVTADALRSDMAEDAGSCTDASRSLSIVYTGDISTFGIKGTSARSR